MIFNFMQMGRLFFISILLATAWQACTYEKTQPRVITNPNWGEYDPTPYTIELPSNAPQIPSNAIPSSNPMTQEGVNLGHRLFFDPIISGDNTMSCATCHSVEYGMTDGLPVSEGILGISGSRNSMPLFNLVYHQEFFWDGRAQSLEEQVLMPIQDHIELDETLTNLLSELEADTAYPRLFFKAFGVTEIEGQHLAMALAQYLRALVSFDSRWDQAQRNEIFLEDEELQGYGLFNSLSGADCFHCHGEGTGLFGDYGFQNNGLDPAQSIYDFDDPGRAKYTGRQEDYGRFKIPSLRNIGLSAPYMHDGRFATLAEVLDHYSEGLHVSPNIEFGKLEYAQQGGVQLTQTEKDQVIAFLHALTDSTIFTNPLYQDPF